MTTRNEEIIALYASGKTGPQVAAAVGLSAPMVYRIVKEAGISRSRGIPKGTTFSLKPYDRAAVVRRYKEGVTLRQVAAEFGISHQRVHQLVSNTRYAA